MCVSVLLSFHSRICFVIRFSFFNECLCYSLFLLCVSVLLFSIFFYVYLRYHLFFFSMSIYVTPFYFDCVSMLLSFCLWMCFAILFSNIYLRYFLFFFQWVSVLLPFLFFNVYLIYYLFFFQWVFVLLPLFLLCVCVTLWRTLSVT